MTAAVESLLRLMQNAYDPPKAIRGRPEAIRERLRIYRDALAPFDAHVLDRAWLEAAGRHHFEQWPDCAEILKAAERLHAVACPKTAAKSWDEEKAGALRDAYVQKFMRHSQYAERARSGGYEREMARYVEAAAHVQSQMICGRHGEGYEHGVLFPGRERDKAAENEFFARAREQAATGAIRVRIPLALIERWKEGAEKGRSR
jgi:hypothetical protein